MSHDDYIAEALHRDGDAIMRAFGFERLPDGNWREEDLDWIFAEIDKHGLNWAYDKAQLPPS